MDPGTKLTNWSHTSVGVPLGINKNMVNKSWCYGSADKKKGAKQMPDSVSRDPLERTGDSTLNLDPAQRHGAKNLWHGTWKTRLYTC